MFQLPKEVKNGVKDYGQSLKELEGGKISSARFKGIRVPWGIYSHRGGKVFMTRVRIPAGVVTPLQLEALASASKKYGDGVLHITTRQDIQIHNVKIEDTVKVIEYLAKSELSPRGGGSNTTRNVIACPFSGICKDEIFDVKGYAIAVTENLLRQETSFTLPRKFKISFSCCSRDCVGCLVNDLGFLAEIRDNKKGFRTYVGGGLGANPRIGKLLEEFVPEKDLGYCVTAVKNIFYRKGDRRNKHHNRLRFLIEDMGFEEFKKLYKEEFDELKKKEHIALQKVAFPIEKTNAEAIPEKDDTGYNEFLKYNVTEQKQKGFLSVELRIPRGDVSSEKLLNLTKLGKGFPGIEFRTSQNQNIVICWVRSGDIYKLYTKLKETIGDFIYPNTLLDVVACKGALTCNLGLCNSPALTEEIETLVKKEFIGTAIFDKFEIKINGCPNACGHQPIGKLSFHGMARRVDSRPIPFYKFFIGGRKKLEDTKFGEEVGIVPARNVPAFLKEFFEKSNSKIKEGEDIYKFLENDARKIAEEVLDNYAYVPPYSENKEFYIDWGKREEFSLSGLGPGECGAGILDMIENDITEATLALEEAEKEAYSSSKIQKALFLSGRALLIVKGSDPKNEKETFLQFTEKFINEGIAVDTYSDLSVVFSSLSGDLKKEEKKEKFLYGKKFLEYIKQLYKNMDSSLNFPKERPGKDKAPDEKVSATKVQDLKGTPCPLNYVKAKLTLETLNGGDTLELFLDDGEPIDNVPKSLEGDGHKILNVEKIDNYWKILVEKKKDGD